MMGKKQREAWLRELHERVDSMRLTGPAKEEPIKHDQGKIRLSLLPLGPLTEVMEVFEHGAKKYSDWNYLKGEGLEPSRPLDACFRHLMAHMKGQTIDKESGKSHLAHAVCSLFMAMAIIEKRAKNDTL